MITLKIDCEEMVIHDIKRRDLSKMLKWYKQVEIYKYATGVDKQFTYSDLLEDYTNIVYDENVFFAGIYLKCDGSMLGFLKGHFNRKETHTLWIRALVIDEDYQRQGYSSKSLSMLQKYFKTCYDIKQIYISVASNNVEGMLFWCRNNFVPIVKPLDAVALDELIKNMVIMEKKV